MRGIEHGRYAIEEGGVLNLLDLFPSFEECIRRFGQPANRTMAV
jgi:hypothetical protein